VQEEKTPIETLDSRIVWESSWYRIRQDDIRLPDKRSGVYNVVEMPDSVFVVPVLEDGRIVLIRNYRYTIKQWVWEIPAGGIKANQSPYEAAQAELLEEAGGVASYLEFIQKASTINGIGSHYAHFYLATGVKLGKQEHEETEFINVHPMPTEAVYRLIFEGQMNDAVSIAALLLVQNRLK
jgi:ADP-ribose pyrophosphatase